MAACLNALISLNKWVTGEVTPWIDGQRSYESGYLMGALRDIPCMTDEERVGIVKNFKELYQILQELEKQFGGSNFWQNGGKGTGGSGGGNPFNPGSRGPAKGFDFDPRMGFDAFDGPPESESGTDDRNVEQASPSSSPQDQELQDDLISVRSTMSDPGVACADPSHHDPLVGPSPAQQLRDIYQPPLLSSSAHESEVNTRASPTAQCTRPPIVLGVETKEMKKGVNRVSNTVKHVAHSITSKFSLAIRVSTDKPRSPWRS
jgi:hypothetical protein